MSLMKTMRLGGCPSEGLASLPEEARSIYQAAQLDRSRGNVEMAREGFREFLRRFPQSDLADNAAYYEAETWLNESDIVVGIVRRPMR